MAQLSAPGCEDHGRKFGRAARHQSVCRIAGRCQGTKVVLRRYVYRTRKEMRPKCGPVSLAVSPSLARAWHGEWRKSVRFEDRPIQRHAPGPSETAQAFADRTRSRSRRTIRGGHAQQPRNARNTCFPLVVWFTRSHFQQTIGAIVKSVSQPGEAVHAKGPSSALSNMYKSLLPMITARSSFKTDHLLPPYRPFYTHERRCYGRADSELDPLSREGSDDPGA